MEVTFFPCPQRVWTPLLLVWQSLPLHCLCLRLWGQKMIVTGEQEIGVRNEREESVLWMRIRAFGCGVFSCGACMSMSMQGCVCVGVSEIHNESKWEWWCWHWHHMTNKQSYVPYIEKTSSRRKESPDLAPDKVMCMVAWSSWREQAGMTSALKQPEAVSSHRSSKPAYMPPCERVTCASDQGEVTCCEVVCLSFWAGDKK